MYVHQTLAEKYGFPSYLVEQNLLFEGVILCSRRGGAIEAKHVVIYFDSLLILYIF